jgi:hypothetical protein
MLVNIIYWVTVWSRMYDESIMQSQGLPRIDIGQSVHSISRSSIPNLALIIPKPSSSN